MDFATVIGAMSVKSCMTTECSVDARTVEKGSAGDAEGLWTSAHRIPGGTPVLARDRSAICTRDFEGLREPIFLLT